MGRVEASGFSPIFSNGCCPDAKRSNYQKIMSEEKKTEPETVGVPQPAPLPGQRPHYVFFSTYDLFNHRGSFFYDLWMQGPASGTRNEWSGPGNT